MIDENKLIKEFTSLPDRDWYTPWIVDVINNQPKVGEWIPCSERLPDKAGFYVVTKRQKSGEIQVALGSYRPLFSEWSGNGNFKDVVAWIPLPEPYKAGDT